MPCRGCPNRSEQPRFCESLSLSQQLLSPGSLQEVTLLYNLCNEPWLKYTMAAVADRGLKPSQWTSVRLQTEVMLAETRT